MDGKTEVSIGSLEIKSENLSNVTSQLIEDNENEKEYPNLVHYLRIMKDDGVEKYKGEVPGVGDCELRYIVDERENFPKRIFFCREQGMLIEEKGILSIHSLHRPLHLQIR